MKVKVGIGNQIALSVYSSSGNTAIRILPVSILIRGIGVKKKIGFGIWLRRLPYPGNKWIWVLSLYFGRWEGCYQIKKK